MDITKGEFYSGETFDGEFSFRILNYFDIPAQDENEERIILLSDTYEFCGYSFQLSVMPKGNLLPILFV